jgi:hypothetical protein
MQRNSIDRLIAVLTSGLGFFWAPSCTARVPRKSPEQDKVVASLKKIIRRGLPVVDAVDHVAGRT